MKFGLNMVPVRLAEVTEAAQRAERLGFESLWVGEHILTPVAVAAGYPGATGKPPFAPDSRFTEPFATVDVLSGGRVNLGLGIGWMPEEFEAVGQNFGTRGRRMDEMLAVLDTLFTQARPSFVGEFFTLPEMGFEPKPVQRPRPPFLIGGSSEAALRRAARFGDGWYGGQQPPDEAAAVIEKLGRFREDYGRADLPFEITVLTPWGSGYDSDVVAGYEQAGVHRIVTTPWSRSREALPAIEAFAEAADLGTVAAR